MENNRIIKASKSVLAIANLKFEGVTAIPDSWYKNITNKSGSPDLLAIVLLSEIVYWHRLMPVYEDDMLIGYSQKFMGSKLQKQTSELSKKYGFSEKSINEALNRLVDLSLITREFSDVRKGELVIQKRQFIDIIPEQVIKISVLDVQTKGNEGINEGFTPSSKKGNEGINQSYSYTKTTDTKTTDTEEEKAPRKISEKTPTWIEKMQEAKKADKTAPFENKGKVVKIHAESDTIQHSAEERQRTGELLKEMLAYFGNNTNELAQSRLRKSIIAQREPNQPILELLEQVGKQFAAYQKIQAQPNPPHRFSTAINFVDSLIDKDYTATLQKTIPETKIIELHTKNLTTEGGKVIPL